MEARLYVDVVGIAKIKIEDYMVFKVYYGGMWRGRPSLAVSIGARELGEVLRSSALWQNQWFDYVAKLSLRERAADEGRRLLDRDYVAELDAYNRKTLASDVAEPKADLYFRPAPS